MKNIKLILLVSGLCIGSVYAQSSDKGTLVEKTSVEVGKVLDFKLSVLSKYNIKEKTTDKKLVIETKGSLTSDGRYVELSKDQLEKLIAGMNQISTDFFSAQTSSNIDISFMSECGIEVGGNFMLAEEKKTATATATKTKNIKVYVDTKEKYFEGKLVNFDQNGKYIWKTVDASEVPTTGKEPLGKWTPYVRFVNTTSRASFELTIEEFNALKAFLEEAKSKM